MDREQNLDIKNSTLFRIASEVSHTSTLERKSFLKAMRRLTRDTSVLSQLAACVGLRIDRDSEGEELKASGEIVNFGFYEIIVKGEISSPGFKEEKNFGMAVSRSLAPNGAVESVHARYLRIDGWSLDKRQRELSRILILQQSDRQVEGDFHWLGYLRSQFDRHQVPYRVPQPYFVTRRSIESIESGRKISVPVLFLEWLNDFCELNWIKDPNEDLRFLINGTPFPEEARKYNETLRRRLELQREIKIKLVDLLSSIYLAGGCLPGLFSLIAGDVVADLPQGADSGGLKADDVNLGLITVRGGFVPLEDYDSLKERGFFLPSPRPVVKLKPPRAPDFELLRKKFSEMKPAYYRFSRAASGTWQDANLFPSEEIVEEGMKRAAARFGYSL